MAKVVDVDIKRYRNIEKGERTANAELLMNIYNTLAIYPSYFICGKLENYQCLNEIFQTLSEQNQKKIIEFLRTGVNFINQAIGEEL